MASKPMTDPKKLVGRLERVVLDRRPGFSLNADPQLLTEAAACIREMVEWRDIETAPRDGTVVIAMGRFPDATAGFPMFVHWHDGCWWVVSRNLTQPVVCWAWKPRDVLGDWPSELPFPPAPGAEDYV